MRKCNYMIEVVIRYGIENGFFQLEIIIFTVFYETNDNWLYFNFDYIVGITFVQVCTIY